MDGIQTCLKLREIENLQSSHILFLTARAEEYSRTYLDCTNSKIIVPGKTTCRLTLANVTCLSNSVAISKFSPIIIGAIGYFFLNAQNMGSSTNDDPALDRFRGKAKKKKNK